MPTLSELVERDLEEELKIIKDTGGRLWPKWLALGIVFLLIWVSDVIFSSGWSKRDAWFAVGFVFVWPFLEIAWERHKVAAQMRHHREVRIETKLDVLLGLVKVDEE